MIEVQPLAEDKSRALVIIDGISLPGNAYRNPSMGEGKFKYRTDETEAEAIDLIVSQKFSDIPNSLVGIDIRGIVKSITPLLANSSYSFEIKQNEVGTLQVRVSINFEIHNWKHLWSIKEYIDQFRIEFKEAYVSGASWIENERWIMLFPSAEIDFFVTDAGVTIITEISNYHRVISRLHELTEASLLSKLPDPSVEQIIRTIEFPPEYYLSGITILSYFTEVLRHKNLSDQVKVAIEQDGLSVRLVIESPTGQREQIERTLETYALVVTGKQPIESLTTDPYEVMELKGQLRIANAQLDNQRDMLALKHSEVERLRSEVQDTNDSLRRLERRADEQQARFMSLIEGLTSSNAGLASGFKELALQAAKSQNKALAGALDQLYKVIERGVREEDREEVIRNLETIKREDPGVFGRVYNVIEGAMGGAAGSILYAWLQFIVGSLPK